MVDRIHKYPLNRDGRDIILGDIHGNFKIANQVLESLNMRRGDRVYTVGDIVNRGEDSIKCFDKFAHRSVRGNHEQLILSYWKGDIEKCKLKKAGGDWFLKLHKDYQNEIIYRIKHMPTAIQIGEENPYIIAHACMPAPWKDASKMILKSSSFRKRIHCEHGFYKNSSQTLVRETCKGVKAIFVGHDIVPVVRKHYEKIYQLDTGVYRTGVLSYAVIENDSVTTSSYMSHITFNAV